MKHLGLIFLISIVLASFSSRGKDLNGLGFQSYLKKDYKKAQELFKSAVNKNPKEAYAWLNLGRTIVALNGGKEPEEYCQLETNWKYLALDALNKAIEIDFKKVIPKLNATEEPLFRNFTKSIEYKKWFASIQPLPKTDSDITKFLLSHPDWLIESPGQIPSDVTFKSKGILQIENRAPDSVEEWKWKVVSGQIQISNKSVVKKLILKSVLNHFDEGKRNFRMLVLENHLDKSQWTIGPLSADCN